MCNALSIRGFKDDKKEEVASLDLEKRGNKFTVFSLTPHFKKVTTREGILMEMIGSILRGKEAISTREDNLCFEIIRV